MTSPYNMSRRSLLALAATAPFAAFARGKKIPIGLELYSVRDVLKGDVMGTVRGVAKMGYQDVEFYAPYYDWTIEYAKDIRKLLNDLGIRCLSTHNGPKSFSTDGMQHAIDLNGILGAKFIVLASAGRVTGLDGWKGLADSLSSGSGKVKAAGPRAGYHNHQA